jgi:hypothetical protein
MLIGIPLLGAVSAAWLLLPKLIQKELDGGKLMGAFLGLLALFAAAGMLMGRMTGVQAGFMLFLVGASFYYGFVLPQRHIRALDWPRYLVTMVLVTSTMSVLLKMCASLAFNIKYVLTIPAISMNF